MHSYFKYDKSDLNYDLSEKNGYRYLTSTPEEPI